MTTIIPDFNILNKLIQDNYIKAQKHPTLPLKIYNYTQDTQYSNAWNTYTKTCRGLILDNDNNLVARPLPKFFNIDQAEALQAKEGTPQYLIDLCRDNKVTNFPKDNSFEVYEKLDGCLGIGFFYNNEFIIASRGSLTSDVADEANRIKVNYKKYIKEFNPDYTYLFEIICPVSKIVLDYRGAERLALLAVVETQTGNEIDIKDIDYPDKAQKIEGIESIDDLSKLDPTNKEGFVIKYSNNSRLKFKFDEYKKLHYVVTGLSNRDIWKAMMYDLAPTRYDISWKMDIEKALAYIPDELYDWFNNEYNNLVQAFENIQNEVKEITGKIIDKGLSRKEIFLLVNRVYPTMKHFIMAELDKKDYRLDIMKTLEPEHKRPNF